MAPKGDHLLCPGPIGATEGTRSSVRTLVSSPFGMSAEACGFDRLLWQKSVMSRKPKGNQQIGIPPPLESLASSLCSGWIVVFLFFQAGSVGPGVPCKAPFSVFWAWVEIKPPQNCGFVLLVPFTVIYPFRLGGQHISTHGLPGVGWKLPFA